MRHRSLYCAKFIQFLRGQYSVLVVDDKGKQIQISDRSIKFHIKYMLCTFSYGYEAYIDYETSLKKLKCNTKELKMSQNYNRQPNEQTYLRKQLHRIALASSWLIKNKNTVCSVMTDFQSIQSNLLYIISASVSKCCWKQKSRGVIISPQKNAWLFI